VFPAGRCGRRRGRDQGSACSGAHPRHLRRRRKVLRAGRRRIRDLRPDGRVADSFSCRSVREARVSANSAPPVGAAPLAATWPHRLPQDRWRIYEIVFWLIPVVAFFAFPGYLVLGSQILIVGLFAVSLDLILGYAGIVSLGHAAFFGIGAYTAGLLAVHGWGEPFTGLLAAAATAAIAGFAVSFLVVRGADLTRLMVTLGIGLMVHEAANKAAFITGGVDGLSGVTMSKVAGLFPFSMDGRTAYVYSFVVLFLLFALLRRIVNSPF